MEPFPTIAPLFRLKSEEDSILLDGLQQLKNAGIECILEARARRKFQSKSGTAVVKNNTIPPVIRGEIFRMRN